MSLIVAVLLVGTLLTITVNERLGEIATLRAIGVRRSTIVRQVLAEGVALTVLGSGAGILLGLVTAEYLDGILTSFPGLPAAFSFFVPRAGSLSLAATILLVTGSLAGLYPAWLASRAPIAATLRAEAT
jgi:putative ABC transport system permease protein